MSNTSTNENKDSKLNLKFKCPFEKDIFLDKFGANYRFRSNSLIIIKIFNLYNTYIIT